MQLSGKMMNEYEVPIDAFLTTIIDKPTEVRGFFFSAMSAMAQYGEPLPKDDRQSSVRTAAGSVRVYRRLVSECIRYGILVRQDDGRIFAPLLDDCREAQRRRIQKSRNPLPQSVREAVLRKTSGKCLICKTLLTLDAGTPTSYEADHIVNVADGGSDDVGNLIALCLPCNREKRGMSLAEYVDKRLANGKF